MLPSQQFDAFYLYDATGNPRWVVGANGPFAATSTIAMLQSTGFCPVCAYQALTTQPAGNMTVTYTNGLERPADTAITLNAPLNGTWNDQSADRAIDRHIGLQSLTFIGGDKVIGKN